VDGVLRHSFGTYCLQRGMNPIQVGEIMGHNSLAMITNVYAHLTRHAMMKALLQDDEKRR
jgi:site-specific recombinase XerD